MEATEIPLAVAAGIAAASSLGLKVDDAAILHASNRLAVRLQPCGVLARVAPEVAPSGAEFEVEVARRLAETESPVAELDPRVEPRVYLRDGFAVTLWTYYEPVPRDVTPREYAGSLERLHDGMRPVNDLATPHFTDRVEEALRLVDEPANSPALPEDDRELLNRALRDLTRAILDRGGSEQLLHGEPHAGNLLRTKSGLLFIDLQTVCRGPIEFDIAHCSPFQSPPGVSWHIDVGLPEAVCANYPGADLVAVRACWMLMLAMVAAWRWDRLDHFPNGRQMGVEFVGGLRAALDRYGVDVRG